MALFKIFKGESTDLQANKPNAVEGYVYYTTDESKFYIDTASATTAVIGINRLPLNANTILDNKARYIAYPYQEHLYQNYNNLELVTSNSPQGFLQVKIPYTGGTGMINFEINITTMASLNSSSYNNVTYYVTGMYRNTTEWDINYKLIVTSLGTNSLYLNLPVYFMKKENNEDYICLYIGNYDTTTKKCDISWPYINAVIKNVQVSYWSNASLYNTLKSKKWILSITPDLQINEQQIQKTTMVIPKIRNAFQALSLDNNTTILGFRNYNDYTLGSIRQTNIGSTTAVGTTDLILGNSLSTTTNNSEGQIFLYSENTGGHWLRPTSTTNNKHHYLPSASGWLVTGSTNDTGVGSSINPVYMDNTGVLQASTTTVGATNIPVYLNQGIVTPINSLNLPGTLTITGQSYLNNNVTVDGQITTNELIIQGQGSAQTPTAAQHIATKGYVDGAISQSFSANDAMVFKGIISSSSVFTNILNSTTAHYSAGWTYRADQNFTISNSTTAYYVEKGDLLIAIANKNTSTTNGVLTDWTVVEHNIDGGLYKSSTTFTNGAILLADGVAGKVKTGLLTTTTATVITGILSSTASIPKITGNTSVTASKVTANTAVTVVTSVSQASSTSSIIGSVTDGILTIGTAITVVGTVSTETSTASQITTTDITATNTSYSNTTVVTSTTVSNTATVVASISIS